MDRCCVSSDADAELHSCGEELPNLPVDLSFSSLTYSHELKVMTGRMKSELQMAEMSFLQWVAGLTPVG